MSRRTTLPNRSRRGSTRRRGLRGAGAGTFTGVLAAALLSVLVAPGLAAPADTTAAAHSIILQDTVVVASTKLRFRLADLATSASVLSREAIRASTARNVQDLLAAVPGAHVMDLTGTESGGVVEARGYASQGTSSHMLVLVDEVPVNESETDRVDWNLVAPGEIDCIEFLRGPAAFLYGNASMAGVVNVVTRGHLPGRAQWAEASGGSEGRAAAAGGASWTAPRWDLGLSAHHHELDGERDHSAFRSDGGRVAGRAALGERWSLSARVLGHRGEQELPGPLPEPQWRTTPEAAATPLDRRDVDRWNAVAELTGPLARDLELVTSVSGDWLDLDAVETIVPAATLARTARSRSGRAEVRAHWTPATLPLAHVLIGGEYVNGTLESRYRDPNAGDSLVGAGDVDRLAGGVFALAQLRPHERITLSGGARIDWLRSSLDDPTDGGPRGPDNDRRAISPTVGVNWELPRSGNAYVTWAGSYKAPTLEQLYDQHPYVLDFGGGPFTLHVTNPELRPQRGDHFEAGARSALGGGLWGDATVYYARSLDEIGFDLASFRHSNIDRSIHYGLEAQIASAPVRGVSAHLAAALTRAVFDGGAHDGKQINTVPEQQFSGRVTARHPWNGAITLEGEMVRRQWIDEDNQRPLDEYAVAHLGLSQTAGPVELFGSVRNLFDRRYATLGYVTLDSFGQDLPLRFPAAGRSFVAGLRLGRR